MYSSWQDELEDVCSSRQDDKCGDRNTTTKGSKIKYPKKNKQNPNT